MLKRAVSLFMYGKPYHSHKKRMQHSTKWFMNAKARYLTALPHELASTRPHFADFAQNVDRPSVPPTNPLCMNCAKPVDTSVRYSYVWVPSGDAKKPTPSGYFFHFHCFRCAKCGYRFYHNQFFSKDDHAWCIHCALGHDVRVPTRRWHTSYVSSEEYGSKMVGHKFPRFKHQLEFLADPNA